MKCGDCEYYGKSAGSTSPHAWHWCMHPEATDYERRVRMLDEHRPWISVGRQARTVTTSSLSALKECFIEAFREVV